MLLLIIKDEKDNIYMLLDFGISETIDPILWAFYYYYLFFYLFPMNVTKSLEKLFSSFISNI